MRLPNSSQAKRLSGEHSSVSSESSSAKAEPIAIIGMGCRFPGAADLDAFWQLMCSGGDAIREIPKDRFDVDAVYDEEPATTGKIMSRWGGFLEQVDQFDASFFGIAPREASRIDPQHRVIIGIGMHR
jgi:acyl transferase domain-containing protein